MTVRLEKPKKPSGCKTNRDREQEAKFLDRNPSVRETRGSRVTNSVRILDRSVQRFFKIG